MSPDTNLERHTMLILWVWTLPEHHYTSIQVPETLAPLHFKPLNVDPGPSQFAYSQMTLAISCVDVVLEAVQ